MSINMNQNGNNNFNSNNVNTNDWRKINPQSILYGLEKIGKVFA